MTSEEPSKESTTSESHFVRTLTIITALWLTITVGAGVFLVFNPDPFLNLFL